MKLVIYSAVVALLSFSCTSIRTTGYFSLKENQVDRFNGFFVKPDDPTYRKLDKANGSSGESDTISETSDIVYRTANIEGHKAFYALETGDLLQANPPVGPRHFLSSALIFKDGEVLVAPVHRLKDVKQLRLSDFRYRIPSTVKRKDTITIQSGHKKILLCQFKKENLVIGQQEFKDCLKLELVEVWPSSINRGYVWLSKEHGIVKWIRTTGRVETKDIDGSSPNKNNIARYPNNPNTSVDK
jgi:hypothetical protein